VHRPGSRSTADSMSVTTKGFGTCCILSKFCLASARTRLPRRKIRPAASAKSAPSTILSHVSRLSPLRPLPLQYESHLLPACQHRDVLSPWPTRISKPINIPVPIVLVLNGN
jgi:hypothetical protein